MLERDEELLEEKVNSRISEKWFYTHLKPTENEKLPRMDMLDLLSQFLDFSDWENFKNEHQIQVEKEKDLEVRNSRNLTSYSTKKIAIIASIILGFALLVFSFFYEKNEGCQFCFEDADTKELIKDQAIEIEIFQAGESPIIQKTNAKGCFKWSIKNEKITFTASKG